MTSTADRLRLYEHAKETWGDDPATTLMDLLPDDHTQLATTGDLTVLGAGLRGEMAELRAELHQALADQTRTLIAWMAAMVVTCVTFAVGAVAVA